MKCRVLGSSSQRGVALVWATFAVFVLLASTAVLSTLSRSSKILAETSLGKARARYYARAAVEHAKLELLTSLQYGADAPTSGDCLVDGKPMTWEIAQDGAAMQVMGDTGMSQTETIYRIRGFGEDERTRVEARSIVKSIMVPVFQYALFYNGDMEFVQPAPMTIKGRIHTNGKLFFTGNFELKLDSNHVWAVGGYYGTFPTADWNSFGARWNPEDNSRNGLKIRSWVPDIWSGGYAENFVELQTKRDLANRGVTSRGGYDSHFTGHDGNSDGDFTDTSDLLPFAPGTMELFGPVDEWAAPEDSVTLRTADTGAMPVVIPDIESLGMFVEDAGGDFAWDEMRNEYVAVSDGSGTHAKGPFHERAGLTFLSYPGGAWKAFDGAGVDISSFVESAVESDTMYDAYQSSDGSSIEVLEIDIGALQATGRFPSNGLIYAGAYGSSGGADIKGFHVKNAETLPSDLTVVSPDAVYIRGDYNTIDPKSAAVIADGVSLLSKAWDESKDPGELPDAEDSSYVVSIATGNTLTTPTAYNGGPNNLVRRHEDWGGRSESITGSIVCLGESRKATGTWQVAGDYYMPPQRMWQYDTRLENDNLLPPFTPTTVELRPVVEW